MKSDLFLAGESGREIPVGVRRGEAGYLYTQRLVNHPLQFSHSKSHSFPSTQRSPIADLQSFVSHQFICPGAASNRWNLVFNRHPMQLDSHCAPRKRPHPAEHISCSGLHLRAETNMTHRLHRPLHYARRRRDPRLETLSGWIFPKNSPLDTQSSPVHFLTLCHHGVSPQQLAG